MIHAIPPQSVIRSHRKKPCFSSVYRWADCVWESGQNPIPPCIASAPTASIERETLHRPAAAEADAAPMEDARVFSRIDLAQERPAG